MRRSERLSHYSLPGNLRNNLGARRLAQVSLKRCEIDAGGPGRAESKRSSSGTSSPRRWC